MTDKRASSIAMLSNIIATLLAIFCIAACSGGGSSNSSVGSNISTYTLTTSTSGTGIGTVVSAPAAISCGIYCTGSFTSGDTVTLWAIPSAGSTFNGWSGGGCSGTASTCIVAMSQALTVTAGFTLIPGQNTLTITNVNGVGSAVIDSAAGAVTSDTGGISCGNTGTACSASFASTSTVTLTATPATGYTFAGWGGACWGIGSTCTLMMSNSMSVTATFSVFPANNSNLNQIGFNIDAPLDYMENRTFADVVKASRTFYAGTAQKTLATTDAVGWPSQDFNFYPFAGIANMNGTYAVSFTGQATVKALAGQLSLSYNSGTNMTSGTMIENATGSFNEMLTFSGSKRQPGDSSGTGITNLSIMRPTVPGSSTPLPAGTVWNPSFISYINNVGTLRFMDFTATNWNQQVNWSDRILPSSPSFQRHPNTSYGWEGIGAAWEYVVLLANASGKDAWINMPQMATDAYNIDVANLFKYGSDGTNPYTGTFGSGGANPQPSTGPVYPPLNPNLHVYVEYGNEVWNGSFPSLALSLKNAGIELYTYGPAAPIDWDGRWNSSTDPVGPSGFTGAASSLVYTMAFRNYVEHVVDMSNDWRTVWGSALGTTIRPVLMGQLSGSQTFDGANMLMSYYNNLSGVYGGTAHPPSYYIYGLGNAPYYNPSTINPSTGVPGTAAAVEADPGMLPTGPMLAYAQNATYLSSELGVHHIDYEGGPNLVTTSNSTINAAYADAVADPNMTTLFENMHNMFTANGVENIMYFTATGNYEWGFSTSLYDQTQPKISAIEQLVTANQSALTIGTLIPGTVTVSSTSNGMACSRNYSCNATSFTSSISGLYWASYLFREPTGASRTITLTFSAASNAQVAVYVDGVQVGIQPQSGSGTLTYHPAGLGVGLHGITMALAAGSVTITSVAVN